MIPKRTWTCAPLDMVLHGRNEVDMNEEDEDVIEEDNIVVELEKDDCTSDGREKDMLDVDNLDTINICL